MLQEFPTVSLDFTLPPSLSCMRACVRACVCVFSAQELCESRSGRPGLSVPNCPYSLCGRKASLNLNIVLSEKGYWPQV